ncbi:MAG: type I-E CRISPR-associated protein Cas6/Cse3/CasE, partial [Tepidisphaeraceae bacterium]
MFLSLLHVNVGNRPDGPHPGGRWLRDVYHVHQRLWMAFPDAKRRTDDPFFLGAWDGPAIPEPNPKRREAGFLFRIERDGTPRILVQSAQRPDWEYAFQNAPYLLARSAQVREFDPAPRRDQPYRFRLLANVVNPKSVAHPSGKVRTTRAGLTISRRRRTEIVVHPKPMPDPLPADPVERRRLLLARWDPWRKWLDQLGAKHGFRVPVDERTPPLFMEAVYTFVRNPGKGRGESKQDKPTEKRYNAGLFEGVLV